VQGLKTLRAIEDQILLSMKQWLESMDSEQHRGKWEEHHQYLTIPKSAKMPSVLALDETYKYA
jgi:hypothetical protein